HRANRPPCVAAHQRQWAGHQPGKSFQNLRSVFTTKPQGKGTGLGLSLSYGIMQEHRGHIRAESQPGEGTEFILDLPIPDTVTLTTTDHAHSAAPIQNK